VRHEAAESLGAIADGKTIRLLKQHTTDAEPIVADSCVVALDMLEFEMSGAFQYADVGKEDKVSEPAAATA
jgi:deoxyhypusine monooxygenase